VKAMPFHELRGRLTYDLYPVSIPAAPPKIISYGAERVRQVCEDCP